MTFHRLMIAAALFLAAVGMKMYLPAESEALLPAVQTLVGEEQFALPWEAEQWLDWH